VAKRVLVLGSGGREHAIVHALSSGSNSVDVHSAPGNAGTAMLGTNHDVDPMDPAAVCDLAERISPDLVVVGPEAPLVNGVSDHLRAAGVAVFGPSSKLAQLEGDKGFAKSIMSSLGIPTSSSVIIGPDDDLDLDLHGPPWVVKHLGLAGGKGVSVTNDLEEAISAIKSAIEKDGEVLLESFLSGEEASILAIMDESGYHTLPASQDHKRVGDGDVGPNTGGMGAYAPAPVITEEVLERVRVRILDPMHAWTVLQGGFRGCLYVGLMIDAVGDPYVVEFNVRLGDPEAQATLPLLQTDLFEVFLASAEGRVNEINLQIIEGACATVVLASEGYPNSSVVGRVICGAIDEQFSSATGRTIVHHGGTTMEDRQLISTGGRVLAVTGHADDLAKAVSLAYERIDMIDLEGGFYRHDIAHRALR